LTITKELLMIDWLADLVSPLNHVLVHLGSDAVSWAEALGFVTGGLCVWLTVHGHIANFAVGIANSGFFLVLFTSSRLWADSGLQLLFIALGVIGWWQWLHGGADRTALTVEWATRRIVLSGVIGTAVATVVLTVVLRAADDAAPFLDALTTALSLTAQWLLNAKKIQTWYFWIAADCIYVPLYLSRDLDLTAVVYLLFLGLCLAGLGAWRRAARPITEPVPESALR
jgi:nicotinamide mononucleotide transporter